MWNQEYSHGRISQSFRSAKPLLDRKRPIENAPNSSNPLPQRMKESMDTESVSHNINFNSTPLMELSANTPYKRLKPEIESYADGHPCGLRTPPPRFDLDKEIINGFQTDIYADVGSLSEAFVTPLKEPERVTLSNGCSTSSILDDDFDDSILEEIDLICEQSARKAACQTPTTSIYQTPSKDNKSSDPKASLDFRDVEKFEPDSNVKLKLDEETPTIAADPALLNSMPDECSKYMLSLNDRQRDAACSNISTPLMVIAGPGSGKVGI
jgi:hypothetical protein